VACQTYWTSKLLRSPSDPLVGNFVGKAFVAEAAAPLSTGLIEGAFVNVELEATWTEETRVDMDLEATG